MKHVISFKMIHRTNSKLPFLLFIDTFVSVDSQGADCTVKVNQLPGQLVYTQITTRGPNCFKFIIALIMPNRNIV